MACNVEDLVFVFVPRIPHGNSTLTEWHSTILSSIVRLSQTG